MSGWRPEGWNNIYNTLYESTKDTEIELAVQAGMQGLAYEAGADAILEALKKKGKYISRKDGEDMHPWTEIYDSGWLVFIPEK